MKKIDSIHLKNFKAFRDQVFQFDGKNVLIYGNNGSGKSSLFWAIYTFLQSSGKTDAQLDEYFVHFDANNEGTFRTLKNIFAPKEEESSIKLTWVDEYLVKGTNIISDNIKNTRTEYGTIIKEADAGSDFINYKLLHNFYNASHKVETNLWDVFLRDIFPYFKPSSTENDYRKVIEALSEIPRTGTKTNKAKSGRVKSDYESRLDNLNNAIETFLSGVQTEANQFLATHFAHKKPGIEVSLNYIDRLNYWSIKDQRSQPKIILTIKVWDEQNASWVEIKRPQSFLNEANLTRVAVAIRLGALLSRESNIDFQVLCLDDMLLSLDMSNRNEVIEIVLNKKLNAPRFDRMQKIILTHDRTFYNLVKRQTNALDWKYFELRRNEERTQSPQLEPSWSDWEKANQYLDAGKLEECALFLRKEIEAVCKKHLNKDVPPEHVSLSEKEHEKLSGLIGQIRNTLNDSAAQKIKRLLQSGKSSMSNIDKLESDFENDPTLDQADKNKLKAFRKSIVEAIQEQKNLDDDFDLLVSDLRESIDFVLNATAHSTTQPLYEGEVRKALDRVKKFRTYINTMNP